MVEYKTTIVTPQGKMFDDKVEFLSVPGAEGYLGILADHAPIVAMLTKGIVKIRKAGVEQFWGITSGVLEVDQKGEALVLADSAVAGNSLEDAKARLQETAA